MKPSVGRIVHFVSNNAAHLGNGADVVPAIITRVWTDTCVNLTVFRDNDTPLSMTSVDLLDPEDEKQVGYFCFWPPRVT